MKIMDIDNLRHNMMIYDLFIFFFCGLRFVFDCVFFCVFFCGLCMLDKMPDPTSEYKT